MTNKKNLTSLAKSRTTSTRKKSTTNRSSKSTTTKNTDDRDLKAKQKVEELLQDIELTKENKNTTPKNEEIIDKKGVEWLEEQLQILTEKNENLEKEIAKNKSQNNSSVEEKILQLFNELQEGYKNNPGYYDGRPNFIIHFPAFLNRMVMFFPFLKEHIKFQ